MSIEVLNESGHELDVQRLANLSRFVMDKMRVHPLAELCIKAVDEGEAELPRLHALGREDPPCKGRRFLPRDLGAASVLDLDLGHDRYLRRCVPVSSACSLYASTFRWTSLCRTTSSPPKRMNSMPSTPVRM